MSWVVWQSDRRAQKYPERWAENHPKYLEPAWMEKRLKRPKRLKHLDGKLSEAGVPLTSPPLWNTVSRRIKRMVLSHLQKESESKATEAIRRGALG
jgi:hypothetical protein